MKREWSSAVTLEWSLVTLVELLGQFQAERDKNGLWPLEGNSLRPLLEVRGRLLLPLEFVGRPRTERNWNGLSGKVL